MAKKFRLYDIYEERERIAECDNMVDIKVHCRLRDMETDGEWCPLLYEWSEAIGRYRRVDDWGY